MSTKINHRFASVLGLILSISGCQGAPPNVPVPQATPTPFYPNTNNALIPSYSPTPTANPYDPLNSQSSLFLQQQNAAKQQAQTMGLLSFLSCSLQSGSGGLNGILGCAGKGLQAMIPPGGGMGGYTTGGMSGYTTGGLTQTTGLNGGNTGGMPCYPNTMGTTTGGMGTSTGLNGGNTGGMGLNQYGQPCVLNTTGMMSR